MTSRFQNIQIIIIVTKGDHVGEGHSQMAAQISQTGELGNFAVKNRKIIGILGVID